jgi:hypothetical protein
MVKVMVPVLVRVFRLVPVLLLECEDFSGGTAAAFSARKNREKKRTAQSSNFFPDDKIAILYCCGEMFYAPVVSCGTGSRDAVSSGRLETPSEDQ